MEIIILILNALQVFFLTDQEMVQIPCLVVNREAHSTLTRQIYQALCRKMVLSKSFLLIWFYIC